MSKYSNFKVPHAEQGGKVPSPKAYGPVHQAKVPPLVGTNPYKPGLPKLPSTRPY